MPCQFCHLSTFKSSLCQEEIQALAQSGEIFNHFDPGLESRPEKCPTSKLEFFEIQ